MLLLGADNDDSDDGADIPEASPDSVFAYKIGQPAPGTRCQLYCFDVAVAARRRVQHAVFGAAPGGAGAVRQDKHKASSSTRA